MYFKKYFPYFAKDEIQVPTRSRIIESSDVDPMFHSGVLTRSERKKLAEKVERYEFRKMSNFLEI